MKRLAVLLCGLCLTGALTACEAAQGESGGEGQDETENVMMMDQDDSWYELTEETGTITVRIPMDSTAPYEWDYSVGNDGSVELLTQEVVENDQDEDGENDSLWVASFRSISTQEEEVSLSFAYSYEDQLKEIRNLQLKLSADGKITEVTGNAVIGIDFAEED